MGKMISIPDAQTHLSRLLEEASRGEDIVIGEDGKPLARLVPITPRTVARVPGGARGEFSLTDAFFDPLPDEEVAGWER